MKLIEQIKKGIYAHYNTTTLWTSDAIPLYQDHVPNSVCYPCVCFYHISSTNEYAMVSTSHATGYDYVNCRIQFSIYANDRQNTTAEDIADRLEDAFHKVQLTFGDDCTHIVTLVQGARTRFWDQQQKIWTISQDYMILAGK